MLDQIKKLFSPCDHKWITNCEFTIANFEDRYISHKTIYRCCKCKKMKNGKTIIQPMRNLTSV